MQIYGRKDIIQDVSFSDGHGKIETSAINKFVPVFLAKVLSLKQRSWDSADEIDNNSFSMGWVGEEVLSANNPF
jgi:hypothetical protein